MNISQNFYDLVDIASDTIDAIGPLVITPTNAYALAQQMPGLFSIEKNSNGRDKLCVSKIDGEPLDLSVNINTTDAYVISPEPFVPVYVIGPHPVRIFTLKPGGRR